MRKEFGIWLREQIKQTGKTQKEFAKLIGIEQPQLSRILSGERGTTEEVLNAIAHVLRLPPETVFRAAGLLPPKPNQDEKLDEAAHILSMLDEDDLDEIIQIARLKLERKHQIKPTRKSREKPPAQMVLK